MLALALQQLHSICVSFQVLKLSRKIDSEVKGDLSKQQREFYLRKQLKAIKDQLGEVGSSTTIAAM